MLFLLVLLLNKQSNAFIEPIQCGPSGDYLEPWCCTAPQDIGYNFPFGCATRTQFIASTSPSLTFDPAGACFNYSFPSFTAYLGLDTLLPQAGIGSYLKSYKGDKIRVVEWSGVYNIFPVYSHFGTVQMWLLKDGSIGVIYHLTGQFFSGDVNYNNNCKGCPNVVVAVNDVSYLKTGEAYMFTPSKTSCSSPYTKTVWKNPPNVCLNPIRSEYPPPAFFIPDEDCYLGDPSPADYCASRFVYPNDAYNASGVTYKPLIVCTVDENHHAVFVNSSDASFLFAGHVQVLSLILFVSLLIIL